jgi:adenylate kinase family enzyme
VLVTPPADLGPSPRIVLHAVTGSGKSTLAARLAVLTGAPHVSVDDLMWRPEWTSLSDEEQVEAIRPFAEQPAWVMDSLWTTIRPVVMPRVDLLVALDYPRRVSLARLVRRTWRRLRTGEEFCGGNTESWRRTLSSDSILAWHFRSFPTKHAAIEAWAADPEGPPVVRFTSPRQVDAWLRTLQRTYAEAPPESR